MEKTKETTFENMKKALINASAIASFCVEKFGTENLTKITEEDLKARIKKFEMLVRF